MNAKLSEVTCANFLTFLESAVSLLSLHIHTSK